MKSIVSPSDCGGVITPPASKSYAQRAMLIAASVDRSTSYLSGITWSDDTLAALGVAHGMGAQTHLVGSSLVVHSQSRPGMTQWYVGESGLTGRMSSVLALNQNGSTNIQMAPSLAKRPFEPLVQIAQQFIPSPKIRDIDGGISIEGGSKPPEVLEVDGSMSSQFISGLLILLCAKGQSSKVNLIDPKSLPYIDMTIDILRQFGASLERQGNVIQVSRSMLQGSRYHIEQDWSAIGLLLACTLHGKGGSLSIPDLDSLQADRAVLDFLSPYLIYENGLLSWKEDRIETLDIDMTDCPDLFPAMAAIATTAKAQSRFLGVGRLAHKESDRGLAIKQEWANLGLRVDLNGDEMVVHPGQATGGEVDAHGDHRMAMALAALGLGAKGKVAITGAESVGKSYPDFWNDLIGINSKITLDHE